MSVAVVLLEIDPSIVKPGWTALLVTVFIGAALVLLFFSLRRQVRRISPDLPYAADGESGSRPRSRRRPSPRGAAAPDITSPDSASADGPAPDGKGPDSLAPDVPGPDVMGPNKRS
jgi:hypothetical protein